MQQVGTTWTTFETQIHELTFRDSASVGIGWGQGICVF